MVVSVDWSKSLRRGSYRGVRFYMDSDGREGGRRLVTHEFPGAETSVVEDMGRKTARVSLAVYVPTQGQSEALWRACNSGSPGILVSPTHGSVLAICETISEAHERDRLGWLGFDLNFVVVAEAGAASFVSANTPVEMFRLMESVLTATRVGVAGVLELDPARLMLEDRATAALRDAVEKVEAAVNQVALPSERARVVTADFRSAWIAARSPAGGASRAFRAIGGAIAAVVEELPDDSSLVVARGLIGLKDFGTEPLGRTGRQARRFARAVDVGVTLAATAAAIRQEALNNWPSRQDAVLARGRIKAMVASIADAVGELYGERGWLALTTLRDAAVSHLSARVTDLKPIVVVDLGTSRSAIRVAYDLYGRGAQARSIVRRNDVSTPALMPTRLEVVQP